MDYPSMVALTPNGDNITYEVHPKIDADQLASSLASSLLADRSAFPKTFMFEVILIAQEYIHAPKEKNGHCIY